MRKRLVNQQCLSRRLLQLSLLCAMMLAPLGAWAQDNIEYYGITVGGVEVTSANAMSVEGENISNGMVSYSAQDNTLTLNGATISSGGITCQSDLYLSIIGSVTVNGSITSSKQNGATLTLQHGDDVAADFTYKPTNGDASGFTSVVYDGMYLTPAVYDGNYNLTEGNRRDVKYSPSRQRFEESQWSSLSTVKFTSAKNYELWLGGTKVTDANKDDIFEDDEPTVSFNPTNNTLTLNGMTLTSTWIYDSGIISRLPNLKIVVNGENIITCNDSCTAIRADLEGAQTLTIEYGGNDGSLTFTANQAIRDFNSLTLTGLHWVNGRNYVFKNATTTGNSGSHTGTQVVNNGDDPVTEVGNATLSEKYNLKVGGVDVTDANASNITGDDITTGTVSYNGKTGTLTLDGATIGDNIEYWEDGELTIVVNGNNTAGQLSSSYTIQPNLKFMKAENASSVCKLTLSDPDYTCINEFGMINFGDMYLQTSEPAYYQDGLGFTTRAQTDLHTVTITSEPYYPLWIGNTQVSGENKDHILEANNTSVRFTPATANSNNTLILDNANLTDFIFYSEESNLTIALKGTNTSTSYIEHQNTDYNNSVLYFTKAEGATDCSLTIDVSNSGNNFNGNSCAITGFKDIDLDGCSAVVKGTDTQCIYSEGWGIVVDNGGAAPDDVSKVTIQPYTLYQLWVAGKQVNANNKGNVFEGSENDSKVSFTPASSNNVNVNVLTLNGATLEGNIISGLGDLTINIVGENSIAVPDTAAVIRSTNGGKLKISGEQSTQSPSLVLSNTRENYYHAPAIKDFASFELEEGLYMSNTRAYTSNNYETPAAYDTYINNYGGQTTKGLIDPTDMDKGSKGIRNVTISTTVAYPIWVAGKQVTPDNAASLYTGVSFTPASSNNGNVNTLKLTSATLSDATVTSLPNLTIEFSGESTLGNAGGTYGFIHNSNPDAVLTFKALSDDAKITIHACNDYASVEGFKNVVFENAKVDGEATYNTTARTFVDQFGPETWLVVAADLSPYGLTIGDVAVNSFNADNILGDGKVSYDPDKYELTLNNATIGSSSEVKNITFNGKALTVVLKGTNTLYGGFTRTETNSKGGLSFYTDAKNVTSLTMSTDIPTDKFELSYQNGLKKDGLVISLPSEFGITIAGTAITPDNRENVFNDANKTVSFNSNNQLVLNGATINGEIVVDNAESLPDNTLTLYLIGKNTINISSGQYVFMCNHGEMKLDIILDNNSTSLLELNDPSENFNTFQIDKIFNLSSTVNGNKLTFSAYLPNYVNSELESKQTDFSANLDESSNTNGTIVDNIFLAMGEDANNIGTTGGYDQTLGQVVFTENTAITQEQAAAAASMVPGSPEFIQDFKGGAINLLPGENIVEFSDIAIADGYDFYAKIGAQKPISLIEHLKTVGGKSVASLRVALSHQASLLFYLSVRGQLAPAMKVDHRIGPKSSVAGALGGVKVSNNSIQNSAGPAATYKAMEKATMAAAIADMGDPHNGFICNDPDITDLPDDMFKDNSSNPSPALRRAGDLIPGTILPDGLPFIDFSGTKITGMEVSRTSGPFNGVPENVFIYMPAGNTTKDNNVVIGDICDKVELNGSTDAKPFKAMKNFKAGQATLKRTFEAGGTDSKATIYLPYNIEQEDADKLGKFYKYEGNNGTTVSMNQVTSGGLKANMPYIFEAKEGGVVDPLVRVVDVVANPAETEGFKGVYERKEYEAGMYCYAAEATSENTKGQFVEMGPGSYVPPFRAYIIGSGVPSYAIAWDGVIDNMDDDENTTAVETVKTSSNVKTREGWWTLNGMRMTEKPKKAGLYILNGRMVVVK